MKLKKISRKKEVTQVITVQITSIDNELTAEDIKKILSVDDVKVINNKHFELEK